MPLLPTLIAQTEESLENIFGTIEKPDGVEAFDAASGGEIGLVEFASTLLRVGSMIAGIWVMFNFILAGYDYITSSGDTGAHKRVTDRLTMSIIGLVLIVTSYAIAALIGLLVFNDASFILNPTITSPVPGGSTGGQ